MRILVFGDSHQKVWEHVADLIPEHVLDVLAVDAATAYSVMNNDSESGARTAFYDHIEEYDPYDLILVGLGEIDCGYLLWKKDTGPDYSAACLVRFMEEVHANYNTKVVFVTANPPVVEDASIVNPAYPKRVPINVSLLERWRLTSDFNHLVVKSWPHHIGIWTEIMNPNTQKVFQRFRRVDPQDHHLSWEETAWLWLAELTPYLNND